MLAKSMNNDAFPEPEHRRPWILIAAYDVSMGRTSEGLVALNNLRHLSRLYRIVLVTRRNNKEQLLATPDFAAQCPGVHVAGFDLPKWACWWKRGARFYQAYAYLWQMSWPLSVRRYKRLLGRFQVTHVLNFHNDSIPSLAWLLDVPVVWGPINHNELVQQWRSSFWPIKVRLKHMLSFSARYMLWSLDPFLKLQVKRSAKVLSAGTWVDRRLDLPRERIHRSQLGVSAADFPILTGAESHPNRGGKELICVGRLDWIKGIDLAIEALGYLPDEYRLRIVGDGPAASRLRAFAEQSRCRSRVVFQPAVARSTLPEMYARADLFLFTSAEAAGLAWVEALACGLPVVAFDGETEVAMTARYLKGVYVAGGGESRVDRVKELASTIQKAACSLRDPESIRTAILDRYEWCQLAQAINDTYIAVKDVNR